MKVKQNLNVLLHFDYLKQRIKKRLKFWKKKINNI